MIAYNDPIVPNNKLQLGIPAYGRNWGRQLYADEICPDGVEDQQRRIGEHASVSRPTPPTRFVTTRASGTSRTTSLPQASAPPRFRRRRTCPLHAVVRTVVTAASGTGLQPALRLSPPGEQLSCTVRHFVYYPDPVTIQQHAQAALDAGWGGVVLWALGYETSGVYMRWPPPRRNSAVSERDVYARRGNTVR